MLMILEYVEQGDLFVYLQKNKGAALLTVMVCHVG